jgi:hypothetical protein
MLKEVLHKKLSLQLKTLTPQTCWQVSLILCLAYGNQAGRSSGAALCYKCADNWSVIGCVRATCVMFVCYWFWLVDLCAWPVRCGCAPASAGRCRGIIFSVLEINLQFFSAKIYKGRKRLRAGNFFHSMGAGRGRSVCPFVSVSWTFVHQCRGGAQWSHFQNLVQNMLIQKFIYFLSIISTTSFVWPKNV